ncbi:carboxylesterase/lipase family protein [Anaeromicropila herbilytica]|uniref:Carboxylic ester hydrolase n=1 Tax=Anaeromicropila herbilytica TaxID=2785025 RepID=A0A7R7EIE1_9FIRM|nr:carboxylesterase family protein [Anaeromicropila herbilytica]BCN29251.1 carboxylic ester hydrolase [Anaeromicropila herbilytica]
MLNKRHSTPLFKSTTKIGLGFWIPYIILIFITMILFCFSSFPLLQLAIISIIISITLFIKKLISSNKWFIRILLWIILYLVVVATFICIKPSFKNRPAITSKNTVATSPVETRYGPVSGVYNSDKSVKVFAGIPYAVPPVGNLRWKAPQEPQKWSGIRKADQFSDCPAQTYVPSIITNLLAFQEGTQQLTPLLSNNEKSSEDCLYLNIWAPSKRASKKRPVIVYIYGGSFLNGSGSIDVYNGENMAKKGAVFITINYRLGIFGFMASPELTKESGYNASGNYGILDQIAALKWVKNNISAFGGDPENITIAGESAGSMSVNMLQASPLSKGLFERVIGESAANFGSRGIKGSAMETLDEAEEIGTKFENVLKEKSLSDLRKMSTTDLLKASKNFSMRPIIDGYVLPDSIYNIYASGKEVDVPTLIGYNSNESSVYLLMPFPFTLLDKTSFLSAKDFTSAIKETYQGASNKFLEYFPATNDSQAKKSQLTSGTLQWFGWHMHTWAKLQTQTGKSNVYTYYFDHIQPGNSTFQKLGAYHSSEISYAYDNLNTSDLNYNSNDYKLADIMSTYWYNFASTGNPNGAGLPEWDPYDAGEEKTLKLDNDVKMIPTPHLDQIKFFDTYESYLRSK